MGKANISFKCCNAIDLADNFSLQYDFILLSNILDYFSKRWNFRWDYKFLLEYEEGLDKLLNDDGVIFLKYIYNYGIGDRVIRKHTIIGDSSVTLGSLCDEEIVSLSPKGDSKMFDGMILKRKRKM